MNIQQDANYIVLQNVSKTFNRPVLKKINLTIGTGQSILLCGANGAGKSTLLKIMAGLLRPDSGSVQIGGKCLAEDHEEIKSQIGVIMHESLIYPDLTVLQNLDFISKLYHVVGRSQRIELLIQQFDLTGFKHTKASLLSHGMLRRLSIARAVLHEPKLILADEPFSGLDASSADFVVGIFNSFRQSGGTIISTTHDIRLGLRCATRAIVIDEHKIRLDKDISKIDQGRFTQNFLQYAREIA